MVTSGLWVRKPGFQLDNLFYVTLGKLTFLILIFSHLSNKDDNNNYLIRLVDGLIVVMHAKHLVQCLDKE